MAESAASHPSHAPGQGRGRGSRLAALVHFGEDLVAGGMAGCISKTAVAPLERIKLVLQTQDAAAHIAKGQRYAGFLDAARRMPREQGVRAMWRGNWASVVRHIPTQALNLAFNEQFKGLFLRGVDKRDFWRFSLGNVLAGGAAGGAALFLVYPLDFCRTRLALDMGTSSADRQFTGLVDCMRQVVSRNGVRGLYSGFGASLVGVVIFRSVSFGSFYTARETVLTPDSSVWHVYLVAQAVTTLSGLFAYPLDTVRRRLMLGSFGHERARYRSAWHCWASTYRSGGVPAFYRGVTANLLRGLGGAMLLVMYDTIQKKALQR